jgi:hypothetical protein
MVDTFSGFRGARVCLPVIKALSSEARKSATAAMSSGSLMRPSGVRPIRSAIAASLLPVHQPAEETGLFGRSRRKDVHADSRAPQVERAIRKGQSRSIVGPKRIRRH